MKLKCISFLRNSCEKFCLQVLSLFPNDIYLLYHLLKARRARLRVWPSPFGRALGPVWGLKARPNLGSRASCKGPRPYPGLAKPKA